MQAKTCDDATPSRNILEATYPEMRWRVLSLAADFDRIQRSDGGEALLRSDPRIADLRRCIQLLLDNEPHRAERVQLNLSE